MLITSKDETSDNRNNQETNNDNIIIVSEQSNKSSLNLDKKEETKYITLNQIEKEQQEIKK